MFSIKLLLLVRPDFSKLFSILIFVFSLKKSAEGISAVWSDNLKNYLRKTALRTG